MVRSFSGSPALISSLAIIANDSVAMLKMHDLFTSVSRRSDSHDSALPKRWVCDMEKEWWRQRLHLFFFFFLSCTRYPSLSHSSSAKSFWVISVDSLSQDGRRPQTDIIYVVQSYCTRFRATVAPRAFHPLPCTALHVARMPPPQLLISGQKTFAEISGWSGSPL
jgi:hypothetical protein